MALINFMLYIIILMKCLFVNSELGVFVEDSQGELKVTRQFKTRCTRRYSPGVCANHVAPVWTFMFHEQNCTERLGCANHFRSNRFKTYSICMRHCRGLIDIYLQMMTVDTKNNSLHLRKGLSPKLLFTAISGRRDAENVPPSSQELDELAYSVPDYEQGENETYSVVYKDVIKEYDIFPPNVDEVDGEIRSQYDLLHP